MVAGSCAHTGTVLVQRFEQWRTLDAQRLEHVFCLTIQSTQPVGPRRDPALLQLPHVRDGGAHGVCVWYFVPENAQLRDGRRTDERQHQEARKHNEPLHARRRDSSWRSSKKQHSVILSRSMHVFDEAPAPPPLPVPGTLYLCTTVRYSERRPLLPLPPARTPQLPPRKRKIS